MHKSNELELIVELVRLIIRFNILPLAHTCRHFCEQKQKVRCGAGFSFSSVQLIHIFEVIRKSWFYIHTSNLKSCISTKYFASRIFRHTPIDSAVLFLLTMHSAQKEQRARWQEYAMRFVVVWAGFYRFAILIPFNYRIWFSFRLTVQCNWLIFWYNNITGMLGYTWRPILSYKWTETKLLQKIKINYYLNFGSYYCLVATIRFTCIRDICVIWENGINKKRSFMYIWLT